MLPAGEAMELTTTRSQSAVELDRARLIIAAWAAVAGVEVEDLTGPSRKAPIVWARHCAMWMVRSQTSLSFAAIGGLFNRDHSTVVYAFARISRRVRWDEGLVDLCGRVVVG